MSRLDLCRGTGGRRTQCSMETSPCRISGREGGRRGGRISCNLDVRHALRMHILTPAHTPLLPTTPLSFIILPHHVTRPHRSLSLSPANSYAEFRCVCEGTQIPGHGIECRKRTCCRSRVKSNAMQRGAVQLAVICIWKGQFECSREAADSWLIINKMTSFSQAKAQGLKWPSGPDDLAPSKLENTYLYAGGMTRKLRIVLAGVYAGWYASIIGLDRYLFQRRAFKRQNWLLETVCAHSAAYFFHTGLAVWVAFPLSQAMYWGLLDAAVGVKPKARNPLPAWKEGEGLEG